MAQRRALGVAIAWLLTAVVAGCGGNPGPSAAASAGASSPNVSASPGSAGSGNGPGAAASSLCALFTPDEIAAVLGKPVEQGAVAGPLGTGCQWLARDGDGDLMIQKVTPDYWEDWSKSAGYRALEGIGEKAYVVPNALGLRAGALTSDAMYVAVVDPPPSNDGALVDLLRAFVGRGGSIDPRGAGLPSDAPFVPAPSAAAGECPLTTADVSAALGVEMAEKSSCSWAAADGGFAEAYFETVPSYAYSPADGEAVAGVGDEAYIDGLGVLTFRVGEQAYSVQVLGIGLGGGPSTKEAAIELGKRAVDGLR